MVHQHFSLKHTIEAIFCHLVPRNKKRLIGVNLKFDQSQHASSDLLECCLLEKLLGVRKLGLSKRWGFANREAVYSKLIGLQTSNGTNTFY